MALAPSYKPTTLMQAPLTGTPICGANAKSTGLPCANPAMENGRCRLHGGKTPRGIALPQYQTGEYSLYRDALPSKFESSWDAQAANKEYLRLTNELKLLRSSLIDDLGKIDTGESGELWIACQEAFEGLREAYSKDLPLSDEITALGTLIEAGRSDYAAKRSVLDHIDRISKVVSTEVTNVVKAKMVLTQDQAFARDDEWIAIINRCVRNKEDLQRVKTAQMDMYERRKRAKGEIAE